jgi:two-component system, NarL family, sensor kinase
MQELINNAVKHAKPFHILAQLTLSPDKILISVDDDGQGFNTVDLIDNKGLGMRSLKQRVDYLKGRMDMESKAGKGTSVNIELNV